MPQPRTISPFLATMPSVDDRFLRDAGPDAEGNLVDEDDPRVRRRTISRPLVARMLQLLSMPGTMLPEPPQAESRS